MTTPNNPSDGFASDGSDPTAVETWSNAAWVPDDALDALVTERTVHSETHEQTARRLLIEGVDAAVMSVVNIALHGSTERVRLDASKYVIERVLGRVGDDAFGGVKSPAEMLIESVTDFVHSNDGVDD